MKKMKIEKQLIFADHVKRIVSLQVQENLTYRHEDDGVRAMGPLFIKGQYEGEDGVENFQETLEMDVLAPNDKLSGAKFQLQVGDYQGIVHDDSIQVMITMDIQGLKEDQHNESKQPPRSIPIEEPVKERAIPEMRQEVIEQIKKTEPARPKNFEVIHATPQIEEEMEQISEEEPNEHRQVDDFDELFSDTESTYTSYRIIVAKPNDTYAAIASRYDVDENALRATNKNKEILSKTLVILPFQQEIC